VLLSVLALHGQTKPALDSCRRWKRLRKIDRSGNSPHECAKRSPSSQKRHQFEYYRLKHEGGLKVDLDEWRPKGILTRSPGSRTIAEIRNCFNDWVKQVAITRMLEDCARKLVQRRLVRTRDHAKWERCSTGATFNCSEDNCDAQSYDNRDKFRKHLLNAHDESGDDIEAYMDDHCTRWGYQAT